MYCKGNYSLCKVKEKRLELTSLNNLATNPKVTAISSFSFYTIDTHPLIALSIQEIQHI